MKEYIVVTRCGEIVFETAVSAFKASEQVREQGYKILVIAEKTVKQ